MLQTVRKYSKTIAKGSLYAVGTAAIAYPLIKAGKTLYNGGTVDRATELGLFEGTGYLMSTGKVDRTKLGTVLMRDAVGVVAIYSASKL